MRWDDAFAHPGTDDLLVRVQHLGKLMDEARADRLCSLGATSDAAG
jgi:hypothetical protein